MLHRNASTSVRADVGHLFPWRPARWHGESTPNFCRSGALVLPGSRAHADSRPVIKFGMDIHPCAPQGIGVDQHFSFERNLWHWSV